MVRAWIFVGLLLHVTFPVHASPSRQDLDEDLCKRISALDSGASEAWREHLLNDAKARGLSSDRCPALGSDAARSRAQAQLQVQGQAQSSASPSVQSMAAIKANRAVFDAELCAKITALDSSASEGWREYLMNDAKARGLTSDRCPALASGSTLARSQSVTMSSATPPPTPSVPSSSRADFDADLCKRIGSLDGNSTEAWREYLMADVQARGLTVDRCPALAPAALAKARSVSPVSGAAQSESTKGPSFAKILIGGLALLAGVALVRQVHKNGAGIRSSGVGFGYGGSALAAPTEDYSWAWDEFYGENYNLVWVCRGKQTGQFANTEKCSGLPMSDFTWPSKQASTQ